jgi:hypothetical protein
VVEVRFLLPQLSHAWHSPCVGSGCKPLNQRSSQPHFISARPPTPKMITNINPQVARWAYENRMGTLMLQSGELPTQSRLAYLQRTVAACREATIKMEMEQKGLDPKVGAARQLNLKLPAGCFRLCGGGAEEWACGAASDSNWCWVVESVPSALQPINQPTNRMQPPDRFPTARTSLTPSATRWASGSRCRSGSCPAATTRLELVGSRLGCFCLICW